MVEFTETITGVAHGGYGVCRKDGQACFVPYALPGDRLRLRVVRQAKQVLWAEIIEIVQPSPDRIESAVAHMRACCGCTWLHFSYPAQAAWKQRLVADALKRIAGMDAEVRWAGEPALRTGYRTRAEFRAANGRLGFYMRGTHEVVDIVSCPLFHARLNEALQELRTLRLRGKIAVTVNPEGSETLVWTRQHLPELDERFTLAQAAEQDDGHPAFFAFDGVPIVNGTFSQSSLLLNRILIREVRRLAGRPQSLLDLYCGSGNFSLQVETSGEILGIDRNPASITAANSMNPGQYRVGGEKEFLRALKKPWDVVLLDPPRIGAKEIAPALAAADCNTVVYVSCDPATLARDLKTMARGGWKPTDVTAVDLFPYTFHIETVCRLCRKRG